MPSALAVGQGFCETPVGRRRKLLLGLVLYGENACPERLC